MAVDTPRSRELARQSRVLRRIKPHAESEAGLEHGAMQSSLLFSDGDFRALGSDELLSLSVRRGREGANETAPPGTITLSYRVHGPDDLKLQVGDRVNAVVPPNAWYYLMDTQPVTQGGEGFDPITYRYEYAAWVTDLALDYVSQGPGRPPAAIMRVTATGAKARGNQARVGAEPWPSSSLAYRRGLIYDELSATVFPYLGGGGPFGDWTGVTPDGDISVHERDVDSQPPVTLLEELAADVGANYTESLRYASRVLWEALESRSGREPLVELTPDEIARTATWGMSLTGVVNRYRVEYGPPGFRDTVEVVDQASIDQYGEYAANRSTQLWYEADARRLAELVVGRNSRPAWTITRFDVDLLDLALPKAKAAELMGRVEAGSLIELVGLPVSAPPGRFFFVEGTEVTLTAQDWRLTVYVSDANRTGAPMTWSDVPAGLTWDQVDPARTWLTAAGWFEPPPLIYRWADVPADESWARLAPGVIHPDADDRAPTWSSYPDDPA